MSKKTLTIEDAAFSPRSELQGLRGKALVVGGLFGLLSAAGYFTNAETFYRSYLVAWLLWVGVAAGLFALGMLNHVSGGLWGVMMRRVSEASGRTLPFLLLFALPWMVGMQTLYPWSVPEIVAGDALLQHKAAYLNTPGFIGRTVAFFLVFSVLAFLISRWSRRQDETGDPAAGVAMKRASALGLVLYVLFCTAASVDWIMSLDPHWFSSLFGFAFVIGSGLSAFAFIVIFMLFLTRGKPFDGLVKPKLFHDYGKLMLAFVMLWAYMMISQYLIIWSGNLPEEITWYLTRNTNGWKNLSVFLVAGHFFLPFLLLLSQDLKLKPRRLVILAVWVLAMRWLDFFWLVTPSVTKGGITFSWLDPVAALGLGGIWLWLLVGQFQRGPALPVEEPILKEAVAHG